LSRDLNIRLRYWANVLGPFLGLIAIVTLFAILTGAPERYLSTTNLRVVLAQTVIVALGALGMTVIIISGGIDLSVGASVALTSVVTALTLRHGFSPIVAVLLGVLPIGVRKITPPGFLTQSFAVDGLAGCAS